MSRWYKIEVGGQTWDATGDPNALNVELDIPVTFQNQAEAGASARVWGISLQTLLNARSFNKQTIKVYGGMQQGLPLADPSEQGLLVQGSVFPALGNWVGTDMTIDFNIGPPMGDSNAGHPANVIHNWPANTPLKQSMQQTLTTAFPKYTPIINISDKLKLAYNDYGFYQTLGQYMTYIFSISKTIIPDAKYHGVRASIAGDKIIVGDGQPSSNKQIKFVDLIGQPIWIDLLTVQFKTVMRGDIKLQDTVILPPTLATLTVGGASIAGNNSNTIQGSFIVQKMRHTGNFRQPDAFGWVTTFEALQAGG